jgi:hypothetical protein
VLIISTDCSASSLSLFSLFPAPLRPWTPGSRHCSGLREHFDLLAIIVIVGSFIVTFLNSIAHDPALFNRETVVAEAILGLRSVLTDEEYLAANSFICGDPTRYGHFRGIFHRSVSGIAPPLSPHDPLDALHVACPFRPGVNLTPSIDLVMRKRFCDAFRFL